MLHDKGVEHSGVFEKLLDRMGISSDPIPTETQWKNGVAERHGSILKFMLM